MPAVADPPGIQFSGEDLPAVHVDLDLEGEPALEANVDEPEVRIDEVEVEEQALAPPADHLEEMGQVVAGDGEGGAGLHRREHADQAVGDPSWAAICSAR